MRGKYHISGVLQDWIKGQLNTDFLEIQPIPQSGSDRMYFRLLTEKGTFIFTESENIAENNSFFYFSDVFKPFSVPGIVSIHPTHKYYLQQDIGSTSLLHILQNKGYSFEVLQLYKSALTQLAQLQLQTLNSIDYSQCFLFHQFDDTVVTHDFSYFQQHFLSVLVPEYDSTSLDANINQLSKEISSLPSHYFLFRDFQSRNIFINQNKVHFIDYQGGMKGFIGYDLVSLIWQVKAQLPMEWKKELKEHYFSFFSDEISKEDLEKGYRLSMIVRFFQLLGAYGNRGLRERKPHFLESIEKSLESISYLLQEDTLVDYPELQQISEKIVSSASQQKLKELINESNT